MRRGSLAGRSVAEAGAAGRDAGHFAVRRLRLCGQGRLQRGEAGARGVDEGTEATAREAGGQRRHQLGEHLVRRARYHDWVVGGQEATAARAPHRFTISWQPMVGALLEQADWPTWWLRNGIRRGGQSRRGWMEWRRLGRRWCRAVELADEQASQVSVRCVRVADGSKSLGHVLATAVEEAVVATRMVEIGHIIDEAVDGHPARVRGGVQLQLFAVDRSVLRLVRPGVGFPRAAGPLRWGGTRHPCC